jgi:flagellar motor switch protein FliN/FliY
MADENELDQGEIERLLAQAAPKPPAAAKKQAPTPGPPTSVPLDQGEIEALMGGGGAALSNSPHDAQATASGDDDKLLGQDDIERLLNQAGKSSPASKQPVSKEQRPSAPAGEEEMAPGDIEYLLNQAQQALDSIDAPTQSAPPGVTAFRLEEFAGAPASSDSATLDLIRDVELDLKIELGRTHMYLEDVLRLRRGSVVPLDKLAGDPVDIYVNGRLIARGEVLVLNDNFCVRVAELLAGVGPG